MTGKVVAIPIVMYIVMVIAMVVSIVVTTTTMGIKIWMRTKSQRNICQTARPPLVIIFVIVTHGLAGRTVVRDIVVIFVVEVLRGGVAIGSRAGAAAAEIDAVSFERTVLSTVAAFIVFHFDLVLPSLRFFFCFVVVVVFVIFVFFVCFHRVALHEIRRDGVRAVDDVLLEMDVVVVVVVNRVETVQFIQVFISLLIECLKFLFLVLFVITDFFMSIVFVFLLLVRGRNHGNQAQLHPLRNFLFAQHGQTDGIATMDVLIAVGW
mmetsp:Transcript_30681/g.64028  ORF Transcript_30681/g.64028 Transcript_30681/m.64028 type:complete len:264 (+) Transcript_30681:155-946(+)